MVSGFRKIIQTQCTFLQNKYLSEVGLWTVPPFTDTGLEIATDTVAFAT